MIQRGDVSIVEVPFIEVARSKVRPAPIASPIAATRCSAGRVGCVLHASVIYVQYEPLEHQARPKCR